MDKLHSYQGFSGRLHEWRDDLKAKIATFRENHEGENLVDLTKSIGRKTSTQGAQGDKEDYSHIYRSGMNASLIPRHRLCHALKQSRITTN